MADRPVPLLRARRFLPLFVTQGLGALNDNLFKNALGIMALFMSAQHGPALVAVGLGVFILPYALFSSVAGQLADRNEKSRLIRLTKLWELGLMLVGVVGFLAASLPLLMVVLFGLGVQATFFSPLKYGILPDHLAEAELVAGNGLIEAGTFLGILAGTIAGSVLVRAPHGPAVVAGIAVGVSLAGLAAAWRIPAGAGGGAGAADWLERGARDGRADPAGAGHAGRVAVGAGHFLVLGGGGAGAVRAAGGGEGRAGRRCGGDHAAADGVFGRRGGRVGRLFAAAAWRGVAAAGTVRGGGHFGCSRWISPGRV